MKLDVAVLLLIITCGTNIVAIAIAYGRLKQKLDDSNGRLERIERWIDNMSQRK